MHGTEADNGSGDGMSGTDRDPGESGTKQSDGTRAFRTEAAEWLELGDFLTHGADDTPAPKYVPAAIAAWAARMIGQRKRPQFVSMSDLLMNPAV